MSVDFQHVFNSLASHAAVLDESGTIISVNRAWLSFGAENGGDSTTTGVGANYLEVCRRATGAARPEALHVLENLRAVLNRSLPIFRHEYTCHAPDERRWFMLTAKALLGRPGAVVTHENTTQRTLAEQMLLDERVVAETLHRIGMTVAAEMDLDRLVRTVVDATLQLTGARFGAFVAQPGAAGPQIPAVWSPGASDALSALPESILTTASNAREAAYVADLSCSAGFVRAGSKAVRSVLTVPVASRTGEVLGGLVLGDPRVSAFTPRQERLAAGIAAQAAIALDNARLYEREREAGRLKDEFLVTISHELRTPLASVTGWISLLRRRGAELEAEMFEKGLAAAEHGLGLLVRLVNDLLDASRLAAGKFRLNLASVDLNEVVRATLAAAQPTADAANVHIEFEPDPSLGSFSADAGRLEQVIWNLITNAIKFSPAGGDVRVVVDRCGKFARLTVADQGVGIRAEDLPRVFERFWQLGRLAGREHGGLGIGLWLVRQLAEAHGGAATARSEGEGRGAVFEVRLPIRPIPGHVQARE